MIFKLNDRYPQVASDDEQAMLTQQELDSIFAPLIRLGYVSLGCDGFLIDFIRAETLIRFSSDASAIDEAMLDDLRPCLRDLAGTGETFFIINDVRQTSCATIIDSGAILGMPMILSNGDLLGYIWAVRADRGGAWTPADMDVLSDLVLVGVREYDLRVEVIEQKAAQSDLRAEAALFNHLADSLTDGIVILNGETEIVYCNEAIFDIFGYIPKSLLGQPIDILTDGAFSNDMNQFVVNALGDSHKDKTWQGIRMQGRRQDEQQIPIEITLDMLLEAGEPLFKLVIRDVTEHIEAEEELRSDATRYLKILDAIPDMIYVKDTGSRLIWANQAFERFFGLPLDKLTGRVSVDGLGSETMNDSLKQDQYVLATGKSHITSEEAIIRYDGAERQFMTTKIPIFDDENHATLIVGVSSDITESKNVERYLIEALEERNALVELKTNFIAMVSHEFRTPLSVILSSVDIIRTYFERLTEERRNDKLNTIEEQVRRLTELMNDVLVINRGDATGLTFEPEETALLELTETIIEEVQTMFKSRETGVDFDYQGEALMQWIDPNLYRHILQNLVSNALKYSASDREVRVRLSCHPNKVTLVVKDQGIGIPEAAQEKLYQTFHRADNVGTIQGTGLGLSIVKRAVETHGGTINFRSVENQGTMFVVTLDTDHNPR